MNKGKKTPKQNNKPKTVETIIYLLTWLPRRSCCFSQGSSTKLLNSSKKLPLMVDTTTPLSGGCMTPDDFSLFLFSILSDLRSFYLQMLSSHSWPCCYFINKWNNDFLKVCLESQRGCTHTAKKSKSPESKLELILALKLHGRLLQGVMVTHFLNITVLHESVSWCYAFLNSSFWPSLLQCLKMWLCLLQEPKNLKAN